MFNDLNLDELTRLMSTLDGASRSIMRDGGDYTKVLLTELWEVYREAVQELHDRLT